MTIAAELEEQLEKAERLVHYYKSKYEDMLTRYGSGVRPSHVSADLADINESIVHWNYEASSLRRKLEATNANS